MEAADRAHEHRECAGVVSACIRLERRPGLFEEGFATGHGEQRELQQDQRVHALGIVERQLGGDRRAAGVTCNVGAPQAEAVEERRGVGSVVGDAHRGRGVRAAGPAPLVVPDELVVVGQCRFLDERQEAVGEDGADEQYRLARSDHFVFQLCAVDLYAPHASSSLSRKWVVKTDA